jgi:hypothetical protein
MERLWQVTIPVAAVCVTITVIILYTYEKRSRNRGITINNNVTSNGTRSADASSATSLAQTATNRTTTTMRVLAPRASASSMTKSTSITGFEDESISLLTGPRTFTAVEPSPRRQTTEATVNASLLQRFQPYDMREDMNEYLTRFEQHLSLSPYVGSRANLLWFNLGPKIQKELTGYRFSGNDDQKFASIIKVLRDLHRPPAQSNQELLRVFADLKQKSKETGLAFYLRCRSAGESLFTDVDIDTKNDMIKDRFKDGLADPETRKKFLMDDSYTINQMLTYLRKEEDIASSEERRFRTSSATSTPAKTAESTSSYTRETQSAKRVSFKSCDFCKKDGHTEAECYKKAKQDRLPNGDRSNRH